MFKYTTTNIDGYVDINDFNLPNEPINFVNSLYILSNTKQKNINKQ
jgi:hypothetical protein